MKLSGVTDNTADLEWNPPESDGGKPITAYIIEYRGVWRTSWTKLAEVSSTTFRYTATNLVVGKEYQFQVFAVNSEGYSSPLISAETVKPREQPGKKIIDTLKKFFICC